jgi:two-component system, LytTR family, sensor kinase
MRAEWKYYASQVIGWSTFYIVSNTLDANKYTLHPTAFDGYHQYILGNAIYVLLGFAITHFTRKYFYHNTLTAQPLEILIQKVMAIVVVQTLFFGTFYILITKFFVSRIYEEEIQHNKLWFYFISAVLLLIWNLIYYIVKFIVGNRKLVIERLQMENSVKGLEIKSIKNNLQPHFIFNALNSIRALVDEDPNRARQSITQLSNILRSSMMANKVETVLLEKELEIVQDYLSLEGIRYEERLQTIYNIQHNTLQLPIPPLMLQTLVENAIKHGIAAQEGGGFVEVNSYIASAMHHIVIRNTGKLDISNVENANSNGFGLQSTKERLQFVFGKNATLQIKNETDKIVNLHISIPVIS